ncbi:hypothetical protein J437_LFUL011232 [Ladona fulva]|uniref:Mediator of RNA polymerase II transcription subunit 14 RM8 domain-containing protein n=1 Tax=Ladona fulva TaxID=123851 RepID=A0A8K0KC11_LADFU|nr:hypothetical protein J437_LFUL011232 [Ladona fulva]
MPRPSPVGRPLQSLQSPQSQEYVKAGKFLDMFRLLGTWSGSGATRVLPQRSWAGAIPTIITQEALDALCSPSPHPQYGGGPVGGAQLGRGAVGGDMSPLERFLGCVYMRRQLQRFVQTDECVSFLQSNEPGVVHFKSETLQCRVGLNPQHLQSLHIKIQATPEHKDTWSMEEIQVSLVLHITRIGVAYSPGVEPTSLVLPLVYDISTNLTQLAEKREPGPASATTAASLQLKRFAEFGGGGEACSLFPAVRDLLANLTLPSDPQQAVTPGQVASPGVGGPPSVGPATPQGTAGMQMHSPMPMQASYHTPTHPQMGAMGTHGMMQQ